MHILLMLSTIILITSHYGAAVTPGRFGLCLGNQHADGSLKSAADFLVDLNAIRNLSSEVKLVRTYGAGGIGNPTAPGILQAAKTVGFQVLLGAWVQDDATWYAEKAALQAAIPEYEDQVYGITIGSEGLYRAHETNPDNPGYNSTQLVGYMADAMATWPNISIGTADTATSYFNGWADDAINLGPAMLLANAFPYWTAQFIENSTANFFDQTLAALGHIQNIAGGPDKIHFMVGEAGWPGDGGSDYGNAKAGTLNAQTYFNKAICPALQSGIDVFMFEAFDEPYKSIVEVPLPNNGTTVQISEMFWGVMDKDRKLKLNLTCPDPWGDMTTGGHESDTVYNEMGQMANMD